jgi:hypothetical protein
MSFEKGDIVSLEFEIPNSGKYVEHSAIVLSCKEVYNHDKCYICAMMTSNAAIDRFTFRINDSMLDKPSSKPNSQVRCHLITYVLEKHIIPPKPYNKMNKQGMERLMAHIIEVTFDAS